MNLFITAILLLSLLLISCSDSDSGDADYDSFREGGIDLPWLDTNLASDFRDLYRLDSLQGMFEMMVVEQNLRNVLRDSTTFRFPFDSLRQVIGLLRSDDGALRLFQWHTPGKPLDWEIANVMQVREGSGGVHLTSLQFRGEETGPGAFDSLSGLWYYRLYHLRDRLWLAKAEWSRGKILRGIKAFGIVVPEEEGSQPRLAPIFRFGDSVVSAITIDFTWYDQTEKSSKLYTYPDFYYDSTSSTLTYPDLFQIPNDSWYSEPTGDSVRLRFDGEVFRNEE